LLHFYLRLRFAVSVFSLKGGAPCFLTLLVWSSSCCTCYASSARIPFHEKLLGGFFVWWVLRCLRRLRWFSQTHTHRAQSRHSPPVGAECAEKIMEYLASETNCVAGGHRYRRKLTRCNIIGDQLKCLLHFSPPLHLLFPTFVKLSPLLFPLPMLAVSPSPSTHTIPLLFCRVLIIKFLPTEKTFSDHIICPASRFSGPLIKMPKILTITNGEGYVRLDQSR